MTEVTQADLGLLNGIRAAHRRIRPFVIWTPLLHSPALSEATGAEVWLKCEHTQRTGSFKYRGALNTLLSLSDEEKANGVVTASTGNHGMAVALAARRAGTEATIYVGAGTSEAKRWGIEARGGVIRQVEGDALAAELAARAEGEASGRPYISPYNDPRVVAGQGTVGIELEEDDHELDAVFVAVGGGGLASGIATWFADTSPNTKIIGCWPAVAPTMAECLAQGRIHEVHEERTLSDGTAGGVEADALTFPILQRHLLDTVRVSEDEIRAAMQLIAKGDHWIVEGAAGVAVAAAIKSADAWRGKRIAIILCGRNIGHDRWIEAVS